MKRMKPINNIETLDEATLIELENEFLKAYTTPTKKESLIRRLALIYKGHYGKTLLSVLLCILQLSASMYLPIAVANIIDALAAGAENRMQIVTTNLVIVAVLLLVNYPMQMLYRKYNFDTRRSVQAQLRIALVTKLQALTISFNKRMSSGRIQTKIFNNVDTIQGLYGFFTISLPHFVVNLVVVIAVMLMRGRWQLLLFFLACTPLFLLLTLPLKERIKRNTREYRVQNEEISSNVLDMIELIPVTRAHALEDYEMHKMARKFTSFSKTGYTLDMTTSKFEVRNWLTSQVFQLGGIAFMAFLAANGMISVGEIALFYGYFERFLTNVSNVVNVIPVIAQASDAITSVTEILRSPEIEQEGHRERLPEVKGNIEFRNVSFHYDDDERPILNGLNLTIKAGETVALVGESGGGKSTLVNMMTGFYRPTDGEVLIDGKDMAAVELKSYRRHIAMVPQTSVLFAGSIRENITYGSRTMNEAQLQEIIDAACLREVINDLPQGLDSLVGEHGGKLSGGQRQRISIARAMIRDPEIILLDEATSALDTVSEKHIQQAIENLSKGKTTIIVAHRLSTIKNADKVAVIKDGKCVELGTYEELLAAKGEFYRFYQMQV
ncbi:MAG: ABC transporter ATP-binding protein [Clostridia bacterium]|nr:ABC transporter ATP-binding protein [Clostridia bacterium]